MAKKGTTGLGSAELSAIKSFYEQERLKQEMHPSSNASSSWFFIFIHARYMSFIKWEINQVFNRLSALCSFPKLSLVNKMDRHHKRIQ